MATVKINLVVSLVPVGTRQANIGNQVFALHLSAAFAEAAAGFEKLLHPWESNWQVKKVVTAVKTTSEAGAAVGKQFESDPLAERKNPPADSKALGILQNELVKNKENTWQPAKIEEKPQVIEKPSLIEAVHALSLYPGSTPNDSGVLHYFKIVPGNWTSKKDDLIAAVPKFEMTFDNKKLIFTPKNFDLAHPENFDFANWKDGWKYTTEKEAGETNDFILTAYVKPLQIANATGIFYDKTEEPSADSGLNFKDYWFRSQKSPLWQDRLEDFADAATDFEKRMAEAAAFFADAQGAASVSPNLWEDLRLMSLGLYAQWQALTGTDLPAHEKTLNIDKIKVLLALDDTEKTALETSVNAFHDSLRIGNRREKRRRWLNVFRRAFGEVLPRENVPENEFEETDRQYADVLLKRAAETPEDFRAALFGIWDSAVQQSNSDTLKNKWNAQNKETRNKIKNILDSSIVREPFRKKILFDLTGKKTPSEVSDFIKQRLAVLKNYFENAQFAPSIVGAADEGWATAWENWNTKYVENYVAGIMENYVAIIPGESDPVFETEPKFEAKPGGLTLQFDKLVKRKDVTPKEDESNWRKIAGVGVIVREDAADKKWHLATAATVKTSFPEVTIKPDSFTFISDKKFTIVVDVNSVADAKHDLMINGNVFKAVFESRATSSETIPQNKIKLTPSFAAPQSENELITVESLDENIKFTAKDSVEFVERKPVLLANTALVPARVPYKNGVRYPFLTYNQRSLISPTALADAVKDSFNAEDQRGVKTTTWTPLYEYGAPNTAENFYKLVPLKFGKKYQMAAFMIDTAGGLPVALQDGKPFIFEPNEVVFDAAHPAPAGVVENFKYWRKVPVGQVRISALELAGENKPKAWQEVPEKVFPLASEVEPDEEAKTEHPSKQKNRRKQLILLHEREEKYAFGVRPPTVDIDVLERWLPLSSDDDRKHLKGVLTNYFTRLNNRQPNAPSAGTDAANDLTIDDPAVEKLLFVLENYNFDNGKWRVVSAHPHLIVNTLQETDPEIKKYQSRWQKIVCLRSNNNEVQKATDAGQPNFDVAVTVKSDTANVVRLRVLALVSNKFLENTTHPQANPKFSEKFFEEKSPPDAAQFSPDKPDEFLFLEDFSQYDYGGNAVLKAKVEDEIKDFVSLKSHQILLETPNATMPDAEKLWRSLNLELTGNNDVVNISLKKDDSEKIKRRNIIRCELRRQQWRWQGKPIEREKEKPTDKSDIELLKTEWAPTGKVLDPMNRDFLKWEMTAFAEMSEAFDLITIPIPYSINAPDLLYRDNFEKDIAARYMRYGLRVFSRYEGLFADARPITTKQPYKPDKGSHKPIVQLSGTGWQRALIRYRGAKPAKPLVQAIVPLTRSFSSGEKVASLMLVLDQTAHAQCGITEEIECQLMKVDLPKKNEADPTKTLYQAGHDPILRVDLSGLPTPEEKPFLTFKLTGAFGHTFDTGARQPLFASSSYVIQGNFANVDKFKFEDWDFAKIRLRRLSGEENRTPAPEEDWTDPVWVQFPPSSEFAGKGKIAVTLSGDRVFSVNTAADPKFPMFKYCLLLTEEINDFRGQKGNETYIGWVNLNDKTAPAGTLRGTFENVISNSKNLRARLLEIQVAEDNTTHNFEDLPPKGKEFWESLLQVEDDDKDSFNAKYRITRVSPVIDVTS